jgi:sugar/nucleoside kinase (ribokinase family)
VVFPVWRTFYKKYLMKASQSRAMTIVGINALDDETVQAKMIVGSEKDVLKTRVDKNRFEYSIFTRGENGVEIYHEDKVLRLPAQKAPVVDTTGAGDSFLSGLLVGLARDLGVETSAQIGVNWASAAIQDLASKPPKWDAQFYA